MIHTSHDRRSAVPRQNLQRTGNRRDSGADAQNPDASRWFLSKELLQEMELGTAQRCPQGCALSRFLLALDRQGVIVLPARKRPSTSHLRRRAQPPAACRDTSSIVRSLDELRPVTIVMVRGTPYEPLYKGLIHHHHYLEYATPVGEHVEYMGILRRQARRLHRME